jgi:hypothetical protein
MIGESANGELHISPSLSIRHGRLPISLEGKRGSKYCSDADDRFKYRRKRHHEKP